MLRGRRRRGKSEQLLDRSQVVSVRISRAIFPARDSRQGGDSGDDSARSRPEEPGRPADSLVRPPACLRVCLPLAKPRPREGSRGTGSPNFTCTPRPSPSPRRRHRYLFAMHSAISPYPRTYRRRYDASVYSHRVSAVASACRRHVRDGEAVGLSRCANATPGRAVGIDTRSSPRGVGAGTCAHRASGEIAALNRRVSKHVRAARPLVDLQDRPHRVPGTSPKRDALPHCQLRKPRISNICNSNINFHL